MRSGELLQADHVNEEKSQNHQYRQESDERHLFRRLQREHEQKRDNYIYAEHGLPPRESESVEGQQPLLAGREFFPGALLQGLHEALTPSSALLDERSDRGRSFFLRDIAIVIDHAYPLTGRRYAQTDIGIFGEIVLIPASNLCYKVAIEEDGVATQRDRAGASVVMQPALEPEEVFKDVQR